MARLLTSGFELGSLLMELPGGSGSGISVQSATKRGGSYALKLVGDSSYKELYCSIAAALSSTTYYLRAYLYIETALSSGSIVFQLNSASNANSIYILLGSDRTLSFYDKTGSTATQVGSASSVLSLSTWYRVEISYNPSTRAMSARIEGTEFASGTAANGLTSLIYVNFSLPVAVASGTIYFDDVALNDATGSYQTSWPGESQIIEIRLNASGDSAAWTPSTGSNYACVDEATPNDAIDYCQSKTLNASDLYNCESPGFGAGDIVNVVHVGCRFSGSGTSNSLFKLQIEKASGSTVFQSSAITPSSTTWYTNNASIVSYPITLYQDPDGSPWTPATLDTMQIGQIISAVGTGYARVSAVWAMVDYTPLTLKSVPDTGSGLDSVSGIAVAFGIADTGHGTDSIPSGTPQAAVPVADTCHGTDSIQAVSVQITLADSGHGTDTPVITVTVPLADSGTGADLVNVMQTALITVTDSGHGTDSVSGIAVQVPVSDTGTGTDIVAALSAVLSLLDIGQGTDVVIRFDTAQDYKRVTVTFTGKTPVVTFKPATPGVTFTGRSPGVSFTNSTPGITFTLKKPGIDFSMN